MPLNSNQIKSLQCGVHADRGGLYLVVRESGDRVWAFRFTALDGKRAQMEFAKVGDRDSAAGDVLTLKSARDKAAEYNIALRRDGVDPRVKKRATAQGGKTFKEFADSHYPNFCKGKNPEEEKQWIRAINDVPSLHDLKLGAITTKDVFEALKLIWWLKPVTADRVRQRLERLFDAAKALELRIGLDNPATWRGNLKHLLPPVRGKNGIHKKKHYTSLNYAKAPALMTALSYDTGNAARCAEVGILTTTRSKEIRLMEWDEIDFKKKQWLLPATKMKIKQSSDNEARDHLVPLSDQALAVIETMPRVGRYVFPTDDPQTKDHQPFFANALVEAIKRAGFKATMHGMRSTFRNWGADSKKHNFRREVLEFCLAHRVGDEAELSYWSSEMIDRRREALQAWADYIKPKKKKPDLKLVSAA